MLCLPNARIGCAESMTQNCKVMVPNGKVSVAFVCMMLLHLVGPPLGRCRR